VPEDCWRAFIIINFCNNQLSHLRQSSSNRGAPIPSGAQSTRMGMPLPINQCLECPSISCTSYTVLGAGAAEVSVPTLGNWRSSSNRGDPITSGAHPVATRMRMPVPSETALGMSHNFVNYLHCTWSRRCRRFSSKHWKLTKQQQQRLSHHIWCTSCGNQNGNASAKRTSAWNVPRFCQFTLMYLYQTLPQFQLQTLEIGEAVGTEVIPSRLVHILWQPEYKCLCRTNQSLECPAILMVYYCVFVSDAVEVLAPNSGN
jgi:hypothetical protein